MAGTAAYKSAGSGSVLGFTNNSVLEVGYRITADAADASIPDYTVPNTKLGGGHLSGIRVKFDGTTPPNSLTVTVKDRNGITMATGTVTATGAVAVDVPVPFVGQPVVSHSGNTTNGAIADIYLYFF